MILPQNRALQVGHVWARDHHMCWICNGFVRRKDASRDHIIPKALARYKEWINDQWNLALAHKECNSLRGSKLENKVGSALIPLQSLLSGDSRETVEIINDKFFLHCVYDTELKALVVDLHTLRKEDNNG